jgi:peptidyl-prolyl cis-trans isomerase A (cyclophilin A)
MMRLLILFALVGLSVGCSNGNPAPIDEPGDLGTDSRGGTDPDLRSDSCAKDVTPPDEILPVASDPEQGNFTLDEALVELPQGSGPLRAILETELGTLTCTLHPNEAPIGVANFIGLARGRRAFLDPATGKWVRRPYYDGLPFHRVIPDFMAQGGDPLGNGTGGPGYRFVNEIAGLTHKAGTLAYANAGRDTNGSQFYICEKPVPALDPDYTIFGECEPVSVVTALTHVPRDARDKPLTPVKLNKVTITRCAP